MKVSIITSCFNREGTIAQTIESVLEQDYPNIEYIIIDGASKDNSLQIIRKYEHRITKIISEPDKGMYEAINKGLKLATGDIVGLLHSDDFFFSKSVISDIVATFKQSNADLVYGNGLYVDPKNTNLVVRNWISGSYKRWKVKCGWLPLHPTVYIRKKLIERIGLYDESYRIAADSEFLIRYLYKTNIQISYLNQYIVRMRMGGLSTNLNCRKQMWQEDVRLYNKHGFPGHLEKLMIISWKIPQYIQAKIIKKFEDDQTE